MKTSSWVIVSLETGKGVMETWNPKCVEHVNKAKYKAVPVYEYLCDLNLKIKEGKI